MKTFSFRAESIYDVQQFRELIQCKGLVLNLHQKLRSQGEAGVELTTTHSLEELRDLMRAGNDLQVMIQTLREMPLADPTFLKRQRNDCKRIDLECPR